ncbi:MAG: helix-turn-helix transcriptional regulator [Clostridiales bacterium]
MALSENIKRAREKQNFSQEYVSEKLGVSRQAVSKWETGQTEPSTQNLLQLADLLKIDSNILLRCLSLE